MQIDAANVLCWMAELPREEQRALAELIATKFGAADRQTVQSIQLDEIKPHPLNPRQRFAPKGIKDLGWSLVNEGQIEPVLLVENNKKVGSKRFTLISGHRRFVAASESKQLKTLDALIVKRTPSEQAVALVVANVERERLNDMEKSRAINLLMLAKEKGGAGYSQNKVAEIFGIHSSNAGVIARLIQLLPEWQNEIEENRLGWTEARPLVPHGADKPFQRRVWELYEPELQKAVAEGKSKRFKKVKRDRVAELVEVALHERKKRKQPEVKAMLARALEIYFGPNQPDETNVMAQLRAEKYKQVPTNMDHFRRSLGKAARDCGQELRLKHPGRKRLKQ